MTKHSKSLSTASLQKGVKILSKLESSVWSKRWRSWLRYCAKIRKVAVSIPDRNRNFFFDIILPPALTQIGVGVVTGKVGKGSLGVMLTILPPSCADCLEI
jgi:hypothetical protein